MRFEYNVSLPTFSSSGPPWLAEIAADLATNAIATAFYSVRRSHRLLRFGPSLHWTRRRSASPLEQTSKTLSLFIIVGGFPALVVAAMISASFMSVVQRHVNSASAWWAAGCGTLSVVLPYVLVTQDIGRAIIATTRTTSFFVDLAVTSPLFMAVTSGVAELRLYARAERR